MSLGVKLLEQGWLPDWLICWGIRRLLRENMNARHLGDTEKERDVWRGWITELKQSPIAINTAEANIQHYEVPPEFFLEVLGPRLKYSSCYYPPGVSSLADAEVAMLKLTCERARLENGQRILDLGCGWGSLTLYIAEKFPECQITAVSNSRTQREFILSRCAERGFKHVEVITRDMNEFEAAKTYDRIMSVEMFEHLRNYQSFLQKLSGWLNPEGLLFVHIFVHKEFAYPYQTTGNVDHDWMTQYFFLGGQMPSDDLLLHFQDHLSIQDHWHVNGKHYARTLWAWLELMDRKHKVVMPILEKTYGKDQAMLWCRRWRVFFLACAELFAYREGNEWFVSHYLFGKKD